MRLRSRLALPFGLAVVVACGGGGDEPSADGVPAERVDPSVGSAASEPADVGASRPDDETLGASTDDPAGASSDDPTADEEPAVRRPKVAIFGVDGATFTVMKPLFAAGRLPFMARLVGLGTGVVLRKPARYNASPVLWNSINTGTMPETHGILNFGKVENGVLSLYASSDRRVPALWNLVAARGGTAGVVGMWNTWPAEDVPGYVVSDRFPHSFYQHKMTSKGIEADWGITQPAHLNETLRPFVRDPNALTREEIESLGAFSDAEWQEMIAGDAGEDMVVGNGLVTLKFGWQAQESVAAASLHLLQTEEQPDLFVTFLELPDRVGHQFWHAYAPDDVAGGAGRVEAEWRERWAEIIPRAYERVDWWIGRMVAELDDDTTILVVSDHGMQSSRQRGGTLDDLSRIGGSGKHHDDGILIAAGPAIRRGAKARASILDVAPLTMVALGMPLSTQFEGHLLRPLIDPDFLRRYPPQAPRDDSVTARTVPENVDVAAIDDDLIKHLEAIGYTDASGQLLADDLDERADGRGPVRSRAVFGASCQCCVKDAPRAHCEVDPACADCAECPACVICEENPGS